jgi:serine/threonine-protein kinase
MAPAPLAGGSADQLEDLDLTGKTLGDFHVLRRLGEGGMGQVYLSEQRSLKRPIALKILKADLAASPTALKRFRLEAEAVARATHPNIVQVHAIGELDGLHYMALEYVDGFNLRDYFIKKGLPDLPLALSIMRQGAAALQRAGEMGIIHRDIKPENILLTRKGAVKIADFGLSRCLEGDVQPVNLTQSGVTMGTPLYMSPEQVEGKPLDPRTDIYSFGVTCYHLLAGHPPFRGQSAFEVALQHVQAEPEPLDKVRPDLPPELPAIVHRMMAKQPDQRYQTGRELIRDLNRLCDSLAGTLSSSAIQAAYNPSGTGSLTPVNPTVATQPAVVSSRAGSVVAGWKPYRNWLMLASLVLAAAGGLTWGWRATAVDSARNNNNDQPADIVLTGDPSQKNREQLLLDSIKVFAEPRNYKERSASYRANLELGALYLEQWRLAKADQFFGGLSNDPRREYAALGQVGHAMVLAFRNEFQESNAIFKLLANDKERPLGRAPNIINRNPEFLRWVVKALDFNAANCEAAKQVFPPELQALRKARPLPASQVGPDPKPNSKRP